MILREGKNEQTTHLSLDQEKECMDDDDIMCVNTVGGGLQQHHQRAHSTIGGDQRTY